jgi:predicted MFS family arabinose efflux permease
MQDVLHWSPLATGLGFLAEGAAAMIAGAIASRLVGALTTPGSLIIGLVIQAASTAGMLLLGTTGNLTLLIVTSGGLGFGHVLAVVAFIGTMTSGMPSSEQGLASGLAQTAQHVGSAVGVAALAAVFTARTPALSSTAEQATLSGLHAGIAVAAAVTLLGAVISALFLRRPATITEPATAV